MFSFHRTGLCLRTINTRFGVNGRGNRRFTGSRNGEWCYKVQRNTEWFLEGFFMPCVVPTSGEQEAVIQLCILCREFSLLFLHNCWPAFFVTIFYVQFFLSQFCVTFSEKIVLTQQGQQYISAVNKGVKNEQLLIQPPASPSS